ncbi:MAG: hypothetical protein IJR04_05190 [Bacteroidales bacterium]|nr:hypothetical protein [Bacteroidales bacterium]
MKRVVYFIFLLLPFVASGQEGESRHRIGQLQQLLQQYDIHRVCDFQFYPDCNLAIITDSTYWQVLVALDGKELLPDKYIFYRQIVGERYSPYFLVLSKEKMGLIDTEMRWVVPMEIEHDGTCTAGCYAPYLHHWLEENHHDLKPFKHGRLHKLDKSGWMPVEKTEDSVSRMSIKGPYEDLIPIADDLFLFITGDPGDRGNNIFGYVDIYGNTTATPSQLATMEKWLKGEIEYDVEPVSVTGVVSVEEMKSSYATVYSCLSDTHTVGYLLVPWEDSASMALFNKLVSEDLWGKPVGISPKRFVATLTDVQQAEALLAELMKDEILPLFERRRRYIGNPDNYTKYFRTYGFYFNEEAERCVFIEMDLEKWPSQYAGFSRMWDACDYTVYINLNLDTRKVIRAYQSSCQSY